MSSENALNVGRYAAQRVHHRNAMVRNTFIHSKVPAVRPRLARMLVGGQGGEVRLKLYLSMLLIAISPPYNTTFPTRGWAELLHLPQPEADGPRRVRDVVRWEDNKFIRVVRRPGKEAEVFLLRDDGSGAEYGLVSKENDKWHQIPSKAWANGLDSHSFG
jgi:hypothetical protein